MCLVRLSWYFIVLSSVFCPLEVIYLRKLWILGKFWREVYHFKRNQTAVTIICCITRILSLSTYSLNVSFSSQYPKMPQNHNSTDNLKCDRSCTCSLKPACRICSFLWNTNEAFSTWLFFFISVCLCALIKMVNSLFCRDNFRRFGSTLEWTRRKPWTTVVSMRVAVLGRCWSSAIWWTYLLPLNMCTKDWILFGIHMVWKSRGCMVSSSFHLSLYVSCSQ